MGLIYVLLLLGPVNATTEDCRQLLLRFDGDEQPSDEILCTPEGLCHGLGWIDEFESDISLDASAAGIPITCARAAQYLEERGEIEQKFLVIHTILSVDIIPRTLGFPIGDLDIENVGKIHQLALSLNNRFNFSIHEQATLFGHDSVLRKFGLAVEILVGTIHNMGGTERLEGTEYAFAESVIVLARSFEGLVPPSDTNQLMLQSIDWDPIFENDSVSGETDESIDCIVKSIIGDPSNVGQQLGKLFYLLESANLDDVAAFCSIHAPMIIPILGELNLSTHLTVRLGHICQPWLSFNARQFIVEHLFIPTAGYMFGEDFPIELEIDPDDLLETFFVQSKMALQSSDKSDFALRPFQVIFADSGSTGNGVLRAWLTRLAQYIFSPGSGYFRYSDERQAWLTPADIPGGYLRGVRLDSYRQIGRVLGLAWRNQISLGVALSSTLTGYLAALNPSVSDAYSWLEHDDPTLFQTLTNHAAIVEAGDIPFDESDPHGVTFVDSSNVVAYVDSQVWIRTAGRIESQLTQISLGFHDIEAYPTLSFFSAVEISDRLRGVLVVDIDQLHNTTTYVSLVGESEFNTTVEWIWKAVYSFNNSEISDFLEFVSGSPFPPVHGFDEGNGHWLQIQIQSTGYRNAYPTSQTCFKSLSFGLYDSPETLRKQLLFAITHSKQITRQ